MNLAKIKIMDLAGAIKDNQDIERNELDIKRKKEVLKSKEAENEYFGNYMNKIGKGVKPEDTNKNGIIDEDEKKNAILQSGRQYGAYDKIRDDEQIAANRAAAEGRARRAEARAIGRYKMATEKYHASLQQKQQQLEAKKKLLVDSGVDPDMADAAVKAEAVDFKKGFDVFKAQKRKDKVASYTATDAQQAQITGVLGTYANYKPDPNLSDEENAAKQNKIGLDSVKDIVSKLEERERTLRNKGKIEFADKTQKLADKYRMIIRNGTFDYQKGNEILADITASKEAMLAEMQREDAEFGLKKTKRKETALEKKYKFIEEKQGKQAADSYLKKQAGIKKKGPYKSKEVWSEIDNQIGFDKTIDMGNTKKNKIREAMRIGVRNLEKREPGKPLDYYVAKAKKALQKRIGKF